MSESVKPKLRMAMIGGGDGAFIGEIHRQAIALCGQIALVAGVFGRDAAASRRFGLALGLAPERLYDDYQQLLAGESQLPSQQRIALVCIVTPNHLHFDIAQAALRAGFHVFCEKPLCHTLEQAYALQTQLQNSALQLGLNHVYLGYPLVSQAKQMIAAGEFGAIRKVSVEYSQDWLAQPEEHSDNAQASWRCDPAQAGSGGCIGDIGSHAHNLAEYVVGQNIDEVCAELSSFVNGRRLDDDGNALFRMSGGARGVMSSSQISSGKLNDLSIAVYGESGGCFWQQEQPNQLQISRQGQPNSIYQAGNNQTYLFENVRQRFRTPAGHPEGFIEAMANIYHSFALRIHQQNDSLPLCPDIASGVRGMQFIDAMVKSNSADGVWTSLAPAGEKPHAKN